MSEKIKTPAPKAKENFKDVAVSKRFNAETNKWEIIVLRCNHEAKAYYAESVAEYDHPAEATERLKIKLYELGMV